MTIGGTDNSGFTVEIRPPGTADDFTAIERHVLPVLLDAPSPFEPAALYIVPTKRMQDAASAYLLDKCGGAVFGTPVMTLNSFFSLLGSRCGHRAARLSDLARLAVIEDILKEQSPRLRFLKNPERHPGYVAKLAEFFSTLKQNLIFTPDALSAVMKKGRVARDKAHDLSALFGAYNERLRGGENTSGAALEDEEDSLLRVLDCLRASGLADIMRGAALYVFDGFYDFNPLQRAVVGEVIRRAPRVVACVEADAGAADMERVFRLPLRNIEFYRGCRSGAEVIRLAPPSSHGAAAAAGAILFSSGGDSSCCEAVSAFVARDRQGEIAEVARRIKRLYADGAISALSDVAVVIPEPDVYEPVVRDSFASHGIPYDMTAGTPLSSSPFCGTVVDMLTAVAGGFKRHDLFRFLSSPFASAAMPGGKEVPLAHEVDLFAREAFITGGKGASSWLAGFEKLERVYAAKLDAGPHEHGSAAVKLNKIKRCREYLAIVFRSLAPLTAGGMMSPARFEDAMTRVFTAFSFRKTVRGGGALQLRHVRDNVAALKAIEDVISQLRAGLEMALPSDPGGGYELSDMIDILLAEFPQVRLRAKKRGGVQVMGMLETRGISFGHVFICGLTDSALPRVSREAGVFLTGEEVTACGIETIRADVSEDRLLFRNLFMHARSSLTLSRPSWIAGRESSASAFFDEAVFRAGIEVADCTGGRSAEFFRMDDCVAALYEQDEDRGRAAAAASAADEILPDITRRRNVELARAAAKGFAEYRGRIASPAHLKILEEIYPGTAGTISVTRLESYARCPFGFFLSSVLGITALAEAEDEIDPGERGALLHGILEEFYVARWDTATGRAKPVGAAPADIEAAERDILKVAESKLSEYDYTGAFWGAFRDSLLTGLDGYKSNSPLSPPGLLKVFIACEANDRDWPKPAFFESEFSTDTRRAAGPSRLCGQPIDVVLPGGRKMAIKGKIDRVDLLQSGDGKLFFIVDYKTGAARSGSDLSNGIISGADLQLPLYILMAGAALGPDHTPAGAALYSLNREPMRSGKTAYFARKRLQDPRASGANAFNSRARKGFFDDEEFDTLLADVKNRIAALCHGIVSGRFDVDGANPDYASCEFCETSRICRFAAPSGDNNSSDDDSGER